MSSGFSAQRIAEQARQRMAAPEKPDAGPSAAAQPAKGPDVVWLCHQIVDLHFPDHYAKVYGTLLPGRGYAGRIMAFAQDEDAPVVRRLRKRGVLLLPRRSVDRPGARMMQYLRLCARLTGLFFKDPDWRNARFFVAHNDPLLAGFAWLRARLNKGFFIYRITHLMAEEVAQDTRRSRRAMAWFYRVARNWLLRRADCVVPMSPAMGRWLQRDARISAEKIRPVVSVMDIKPDRTEAQSTQMAEMTAQMRERFARKKCRRWLVYAGTINPFRELDFLIDVLARLRKDGVDAGLLLLGKVNRWGGSLDALKAHAVEMDVADYILWSDPVPSWALPDVLALCDVGLSPFPDNPVLRCNSPLKTLEYLRAGVPVVASAIPDHEDYVVASRAGLVVPHEVAAFAGAVEKLLDEGGHVHTSRSQDMKAWLAENRSLESAADIFQSIFDGLPAGRRGK